MLIVGAHVEHTVDIPGKKQRENEKQNHVQTLTGTLLSAFRNKTWQWWRTRDTPPPSPTTSAISNIRNSNGDTDYVDYSNETCPDQQHEKGHRKQESLSGNSSTINNNKQSGSEPTNNKRKQEQNFPVRLHYMLGDMETDGLDHIASWQPHGRSFIIHKPQTFENEFLPLWVQLWISLRRSRREILLKSVDKRQDRLSFPILSLLA